MSYEIINFELNYGPVRPSTIATPKGSCTETWSRTTQNNSVVELPMYATIRLPRRSMWSIHIDSINRSSLNQTTCFAHSVHIRSWSTMRIGPLPSAVECHIWQPSSWNHLEVLECRVLQSVRRFACCTVLSPVCSEEAPTYRLGIGRILPPWSRVQCAGARLNPLSRMPMFDIFCSALGQEWLVDSRRFTSCAKVHCTDKLLES